MSVPRPPTSLGDIMRWAREMYDWAISNEQLSAPDTLLFKTTRGTGRSANPGSDTGGPGGTISWLGQWDENDAYGEGDIVRCDDFTTEISDGRKAGMYRCIDAVAESLHTPNTHPSEDTAHWEMEARGHWAKLLIRNGSRIIEHDLTGTYKFKIYDHDTPSYGSVTIDLADIPVGATEVDLKIREISGKDTESGNCYKMLVIGSDWYT